MSRLYVQPATALRGSVRVPGDKSISHRALMLGALADGVSRVTGFLPSGDCLATLGIVRALGIKVEVSGFNEEKPIPAAKSGDAPTVIIHGKGLRGLQEPAAPLNCVRSGTSMRLLAGILAGQPFDSVLTGEPQLLRRPMRRITEPLRAMGADIVDVDGRAPLVIHGRRLTGFEHTLTVASAQVKSAILLAGLFADGKTIVHQCGPARDHTERMLRTQIRTQEAGSKRQEAGGKRQEAGGRRQEAGDRGQESARQRSGEPSVQNQKSKIKNPLTFDQETITLDPESIKRLAPLNIVVPGDISSAAFPLAAALLVADSDITLEGVGVNWTRTGLLDVLGAMGADIAQTNVREQGGEPVADVIVRASDLRGVEVGGDTVVRMIDEFPVLAVAATQAHGVTVVRDARELRVKETDRIATTVAELRKLGARIAARDDGFIVEGPTPLHGGVVDSHGDHRLGMALAVAGLAADGEVTVENADCIADSFPGFVEVMRELGGMLTTETAARGLRRQSAQGTT